MISEQTSGLSSPHEKISPETRNNQITQHYWVDSVLRKSSLRGQTVPVQSLVRIAVNRVLAAPAAGAVLRDMTFCSWIAKHVHKPWNYNCLPKGRSGIACINLQLFRGRLAHLQGKISSMHMACCPIDQRGRKCGIFCCSNCCHPVRMREQAPPHIWTKLTPRSIFICKDNSFLIHPYFTK